MPPNPPSAGIAGAELESRLIERLTETLLECLEAPELKEHTWVIVEGHDAHRWGRNAKPWDEGGT